MQQLLQEICTAFPPERYTGPVNSGCTCKECTQLAAEFQNQSWASLSDSTLEVHFGSLPLLSHQALIAFLPAWLTRSLSNMQDAEQKIRQWTLYATALYSDSELNGGSDSASKRTRLRQFYEALRPEKALVVEQWLKFTRQQAKINDLDRESIDAALELIGSILGPTPANEAAVQE